MSYPNSQGNSAGAIPVYITSGGGGGSSTPYVYTPLGFQQITVLTSATHLTPPVGAKFAFVNVAGTAGISYRDDGTAPTATIGMQISQGNTLSYSGNLAAIQFIQTAASAILNISYYS